MGSEMSASKTSSRVALGLGGNRGSVDHAIRRSIESLNAHPQIHLLHSSSLYETSPVGRASDSFLNAAALVETDLPPHELLRLCQLEETAAGRVRDARWDNRPLDIDILLWGTETLDDPDIVIPHRWLHVRRFAIDPLAEIAPDWIHPTFGLTLNQIFAHWEAAPLKVHLSDQALADEFQRQHRPHVAFVERASEAHLHLAFEPVDEAAWPPQINLATWPLETQAAITAALDGVVEKPRLWGDTKESTTT